MKKFFNSKLLIRIIALALITLTVLPCLVSCKARPLAQGKLAKTEVGKVGDYTVLYEEFYFLAYSYCETVKDQYKNDDEGLKKAIWKYVEENIVANYAILELCKTEGLVYDEKELRADVEKYIELLIESEFDGSRSDYLKSQEVVGITDHYVRFTTGVDLLYDRLATKYKESGVVPNTDSELVEYIKENFAHTWHIAILIEGEDTRESELAKAEAALAELNNGKTMYQLIGSTYNEDLNMDSLSNTFGHYFPRGVMNAEYEKAAFELDVMELSGIIEGKAQNINGKYVDCFYIIQRLANEEEEIKTNLDALSDSAHSALIAEKMEAVKATLSFEANDYAKGLDVINLEAPKNGADYQMIIIVLLSVLACAAVITLVIVIRRVRTKRFHKAIQVKKK